MSKYFRLFDTENKLLTIFTGTEPTTAKFATYTNRVQKLNKLFPSLQLKGITFSLQHTLVTGVTVTITEEHETQNKSKNARYWLNPNL